METREEQIKNTDKMDINRNKTSKLELYGKISNM